MTSSGLMQPTRSGMFYGRNDDWYISLLDDVKSTLTEAVFTSRMVLIEGYHLVGERLRMSEEYMPITELVQMCADDMGVSTRKLWYAVQFYDAFPDINKLPEGKNITWSKIKTKYLPQTTREVEKKEKHCPHCGGVL
jgi:hypothetical protein